MAALVAFSPNTSLSQVLTTAQSNIIVGGSGHYLRFANQGAGNTWIQFYEAAQAPPTVAAATGMLILAGEIEVFSVASDTTRVAAIGDANGCTLNISRGEGM